MRQLQLTATEVGRVEGLVDAASRADGVGPVSEAVSLHLRAAADGHAAPGIAQLVALAPGAKIVGYAHLDRIGLAVTDLAGTGTSVGWGKGEFVVDPGHRRAGVGTALLDSQLIRVGVGTPSGALRVWAHGDLPAAAALARSRALSRGRVLWRMGRSLREAVPARPLPHGLRLREFRPGSDDAAWLRVNNQAFAGHPDQSGWTPEDLAARMRAPWFDPRGFLLAVADDGAIAGFHWTKVHAGEGTPYGEVYVLGVDPAAQGKALGPALTVAGLKHLRSRGLRRVILYVDDDNPAARATYQHLGFTDEAVDVQYQTSAAAPT